MSNTSEFDFSKWDFPEDRIWLHIPVTEMIIKICTFVPVILLGLFGNYIIVRLIILNRSLRTPTNLIIANMAVADFLLLLICPGMFMINDFYQNYEMGYVGCKMEGFLVTTFLITAVLNLSVVSYDRLTAIVLPTETRLNMFGVKFVIAGTWLAGLLLAMPLAFYRAYKVRQWQNFRETYCKENNTFLPKYWYFLMTIIVWLPLTIMLICYSAIFYKLDRYEKRNLNREHPLSVSYKKTVAKTLFIVVIVFIILRLPFTIMIILGNKIISHTANMYDTSFRICWYISQYLMFLNAAVNPFIYGFNNDNFRRAYAQTPLCQCCQRKMQLKHKQPPQQQQRTGNQAQPASAGRRHTDEQQFCGNCSITRILCCDCSRAEKNSDMTTQNVIVGRTTMTRTSKITVNMVAMKRDVNYDSEFQVHAEHDNDGYDNDKHSLNEGFI